MFEQRPQSAQSVPGEQSEYTDPGPPSSQSPSREWTQKFVHIVASIGAAVAAAFAAGSAATTATFSAGGEGRLEARLLLRHRLGLAEQEEGAAATGGRRRR